MKAFKTIFLACLSLVSAAYAQEPERGSAFNVIPFETMICFKQGQVFGDVHVISESTAGGNCLPGDLGWVIERNQRPASFWENARVACLLEGMRLPEPFEFQYSCRNAASYGLNAMTGDWEWSSNSAAPIFISSLQGLGVTRIGLASCNSSGAAWVGNSNQISDSGTFRCVR